ncbi:MAG TPA: creatininase family protein [Actinophytocola sp.]|uniref:creatininase family protein n=1 Tax=Actinophytocola sp. TaxID=1872138 RepID=UPI002DBBA762|nr:creatininase family protein [Actinophytocola sp.]HEU5470393.1 creatininase family protein [Actinophytocola sp.]
MSGSEPSNAVTIHFADLTSPQAGELLSGPRVPVLLLPVGAVEPHGPHGPLGTDGLISAGICERAARALADDPELRVLILPGLPYGVTRFAAAFPGAVSVTAPTLRAILLDVCESLAGQGFRRLVVVNNHFEPEHVTAVRAAVAEAGAGYLDLLRRANAARLTEEFRSSSCHGGRYETSLVLADHPELVDPAVLSAQPEVRVDMVAAMAAGRTDFVAMGMDRAYCGAPAQATAAEGRSTFDTLTAMLVEVIRDVARRP